MLEEYELNIIRAKDGNEVLEIFKKSNEGYFDVILMDVMMPKMNGFKISRLLKFDTKYKNIPILMLTARSQESDKQIGVETGANEYITKPFEIDDVLNRVAKYLGN